MSKLRSVDTHFWQDEYIVELDPIEKLLFLYLLTNPATGMSGCYERPLRVIAFDTGIDRDMVVRIIDRFQRERKIAYQDGWVILFNFNKHNNLNPNMKVAAEKEIQAAPGWVRSILLEGLSKDSERVSIGLHKDQRNRIELNRIETESERESSRVCPASEEEQEHLDQILDSLRKSLNVNTLRHESDWCDSIQWAYQNNFSAEQFVECFELLGKETWRSGNVTGKVVADNLPTLGKLRDKLKEHTKKKKVTNPLDPEWRDPMTGKKFGEFSDGKESAKLWPCNQPQPGKKPGEPYERH